MFVSIIGLLDILNKSLILIITSKRKTATKAPIGSIKAKTPLIIPKELPSKNPTKKVINNNEYLLHGLVAHIAN